MIHKVLINGEPAKTAGAIAEAVQLAPETVCIESGPAISPPGYDGALLDLRPCASVGFIAGDGLMGQIFVTDAGRGVEVSVPTTGGLSQ